ncbi:hypothetical protein ACHHYP_15706 [Achlya hypogyna]|uniref:START domain-containing protein n=1 Tax=Achlya hypogyna TaxID=1202772 RepID=A0A1V9YAC5_ACHHY|nr:hypothetical protein ACHHYP_15706 [Achlya hypogyna]
MTDQGGDEELRRQRARDAFHRTQDKQRAELAYLHTKVAELQDQVRVLTESNELCAMVEPPSEWKQIAQREHKRRIRAMRENERLKASLEEQVKFAESLAAIVRKKPRLLLFPVDTGDPDDAVLEADSTARRATAHALLDAELGLLDSAFVEAKLIDPESDRRGHSAVAGPASLEVHTIVHTRVAGGLSLVGRAVWDVFRGAYPVRSLEGSYELVEEMDEDTSYLHSHRHYATGSMLRRVILRRYIDGPHRWLIVGRHISKDAAFPVNQPVSRERFWVSLEEETDDDGKSWTTAKYFQKSKPCFAQPPTDASQYLMQVYADHTLNFERAIRVLVDTDGSSSSDESAA